MEEKMVKLRNELKMQHVKDFDFLSSDRTTLTIAASFDFSYYHTIEITFFGVRFISCPTRLSSAELRFATEEECKYVCGIYEINHIAEECTVFCFEEDFRKGFIIAKDISYNTDTVFYYRRENLQEGERIAHWVE